MADNQFVKIARQNAESWLQGNFDEDTKKEVKRLLEKNDNDLIEAFYKHLEFGTGGLRGIMGVGTNRMNIYTVGMATQGFANYLKKVFSDLPEIKIAIAYDCRNNSKLFAQTTADILSANGFIVYLFDDLRPTPELSFAVRYLNCQGGIVITASHNPKEYNGYKVYWNDGAQVIAPHDKNIINEVLKIKDVSEVKFNAVKENIKIIGDEIDNIYTNKICELSLSSRLIKKHNNLKIVYTPIHGTGVKLVPMTLNKMGFNNVTTVEEQMKVDGNFPTVHSPNPEEKSAMQMALDLAKNIDADIIMATDPDSDRVGIGVKNKKNDFILLNGNQAAAILIYYLLNKWREKEKLTGKEFIVKTIVTSDLLSDIAEDFDVSCYNVLTGFKYIADLIRRYEGLKQFIGGGEESYGYLVSDFVRDKDAVISCAMFAEIAAWALDQNKTLYDILLEIYLKYGYYKEELLSVTKKGKDGAEEISKMMDRFRFNPPETINGSAVMLIHDYQKQQSFDILSELRYDIDLPKSNVLQFILKDGSKISIRPSGTEPKIKFYFSVKENLPSLNQFEGINSMLEKRIKNIINDLKINQ
ncbi:MAG: phospho-sugar mutase [Marinilabiliales bacterium]